MNGLQLLSVEASHVYAIESLPPHHKDPFDRLLIAQASVESVAIITADSAFAQCGIQPIG